MHGIVMEKKRVATSMLAWQLKGTEKTVSQIRLGFLLLPLLIMSLYTAGPLDFSILSKIFHGL